MRGELISMTVAGVGQGPAARTLPCDGYGTGTASLNCSDKTSTTSKGEGARKWRDAGAVERVMRAHARTGAAQRCVMLSASCGMRWKPPVRRRRIQERRSIILEGVLTLSIASCLGLVWLLVLNE